MAHKIAILFFVCMAALASAAPGGWFGPKHEHVVIHVPYNVHTVHHHHVEKVPIIKHVPYIKHVPIYKEVHVPIVKEVPVPIYKEASHGWSSGGWW